MEPKEGKMFKKSKANKYFHRTTSLYDVLYMELTQPRTPVPLTAGQMAKLVKGGQL
jgi:hypothetical protein